jgi:predicted RNA-binding Zn-ribbon protein involved in translation (DUF1610 family)
VLGLDAGRASGLEGLGAHLLQPCHLGVHRRILLRGLVLSRSAGDWVLGEEGLDSTLAPEGAAVSGPHSDDPSVELPEGDDEMRSCPLCGEQIRKAAIKCRFCGEHLKKRKPGGYDSRQKAIDDASTLSLVLGIVAFVACPCAGPFAVWKANEARRLAREARREAPGTATAGLVLGWIFTAMSGLLALIFLAYAVLIVVVIVSGGR